MMSRLLLLLFIVYQVRVRRCSYAPHGYWEIHETFTQRAWVRGRVELVNRAVHERSEGGGARKELGALFGALLYVCMYVCMYMMTGVHPRGSTG